MTSHTISLMWCRSPSFRVIGSIENYDALTFLCDPMHSVGFCRFNCVDVVCGFVPPSSSSTSYPCEGDIWPSRRLAVASCATAATAFSCSTIIYATSHATHASTAAASFLLFSTNCVMCSLAPYFFSCAANFSISAMSGAHHSNGHVSMTLKMTLSVAAKGSFLH